MSRISLIILKNVLSDDSFNKIMVNFLILFHDSFNKA